MIRSARFRGRPGTIAGGVDRPHLYVVFRAVGQAGDGVGQAAGSPGVIFHGPVGVGLVGGNGLDIAHIVGFDSRSAGVGGCGPGHGKSETERAAASRHNRIDGGSAGHLRPDFTGNQQQPTQSPHCRPQQCFPHVRDHTLGSSAHLVVWSLHQLGLEISTPS